MPIRFSRRPMPMPMLDRPRLRTGGPSKNFGGMEVHDASQSSPCACLQKALHPAATRPASPSLLRSRRGNWWGAESEKPLGSSGGRPSWGGGRGEGRQKKKKKKKERKK